jgi:hypothetical protein
MEMFRKDPDAHVRMHTYAPPDMLEITITYTYMPDQPQTRSDPGCPAEVEFFDITINGQEISSDLEELLFDVLGDKWEENVLLGHSKLKSKEAA